MGNVTNKDITQTDICFNYFVKTLISEFKMKHVHCSTLRDILDYNLDDTIISYKTMVALSLKPSSNKELYEFQKQMIRPFVHQICNLQESFLDWDYVNENLDIKQQRDKRFEPFLILIGFSQGNMCKIVGVCKVDFRFEVLSEKVVPDCSLLCAFKSIDELSSDGSKTQSKELREYITKCQELTDKQRTKDMNLFKSALFKIKEDLVEVKVGLGHLCLFFAHKTLIARGHTILFLNTQEELFKYYSRLGYKIGFPENEISFQSFRRYYYVQEQALLTTILEKVKTFYSLDLSKDSSSIDLNPNLSEELTMAHALNKKVLLNMYKEGVNIDNSTLFTLFTPLNQAMLDRSKELFIGVFRTTSFIQNLSDIFDFDTGNMMKFSTAWNKDLESFRKFMDYSSPTVDHRDYDL